MLYFNNYSTAGNAHITNSYGLYFIDNSTAENARLITSAGGYTAFASAGPLSDGQVSAGSIEGAGNYDLGSSTLTVGGNGLSTAVSGIISGTGSLIKTGGGTLTLSGANTFAGTTSIAQGVIRVGNASALGTVSGGTIVAAGAALELQGGISIGTEALTLNGTGLLGGALRNLSGTNTSAGTVTLASDTRIASDGGALSLSGGITGSNVNLTVGGDGATTISGAIAIGSGSLTKDGAGTLTLTGASSYTGTTLIVQGILRIRNTSALGTVSGGTSVAAGATLDLMDDLTINSEVLTLNGSGMSNGGALRSLSGTNTYAGAITLGSDTRIASGSSTLFLTGGISGTGFDLMVGGDGSTVIQGGGISTGSGSLTKEGTGILILQSGSSYSGATVVNGGLLRVGAANVIASSSAFTLADVGGAGFDLDSHDQSIGTLSGGGNSGGFIVLGSAALTINQSADSSYAGRISGGGGVTKTGAGTLTLTGNSYFTGSVSILGGALRIGSNTALGSALGATSVASGTTLELTGGVDISWEALTLNGAGVSTRGALRNLSGSNHSGGAITLGSATRIVSDAGTLTLSGGISGTNADLTVGGAADTVIMNGIATGIGSLTKVGNGTLTLHGSTSYSGATLVNAGTMRMGTANVLGSSSGLTLANVAGALFDLNGSNQTIRALGGGGSNGGNIALGSARLTVNQAATSNYGGVISGSGGLTKAGSGTLTLSGANTYDGTTSVTDGTLLINGSIASSAVSVGNGGTLGGSGTIAGAVTVASGGALSAGNSPGTLTVASLTLQTGSNTVFELNTPGVAGGGTNDRIIVNGTGAAGNLQLGGTLTANVASAGYYQLFDVTGGGTISGSFGTVAVSAPTVAGAAGTIYNAPAGASSEVNLAVVGSGQNLQFWDGGDQSGNGTVDGGAGSWSAANTNWTKAPGEAGINAPWLGSVGVFQGTAGTVAVSGTQDFDTLQFNSDGYVLNGGSLRLGVAGGGMLNISAGVTTTIGSSFVDGTGTSLSKVGAGTLVLSGSNSYSGGATVSAGVLSVSADVNLGAASGALTLDGGVLQVTGTGLTQLARNIVFGANGGGFDIADGGNTFTVAQSLSGTGALSKAGAGTLVLSGANSYTGATTVAGGTLRAGAAGSFSAVSTFTVASGAVLDLAGSSQSIGSLAGSGAVTLGAGTLTAGANNASTTFSGAISGTGGLTKAGAGTFMLSGANSYTGATTVAGGTLQAGAAGAFAPASAFTVAAGAVLDLAGFDESIGSLAGAGAVALGAATLTAGADGSSTGFSGAISGSGGLTKVGAGTFMLSGANAYAGATTVTAGTLRAGAAGSFAPSSAFTVASGAVLDLAGFSQSIASLAGAGTVTLGSGTLSTGSDNTSTSFSGAITGTGGLNKAGTGSFTLTETSSYSGATTVNGGKLVVNGSLASAVTVNARATLGGSGTVGGVVVAGGGMVAPGNSIGTLSVAGNVAFAAGSTYQIEINATGQGDRINATGVATLSGGAVQALAENGNYAVSTSYTILSATGGVTGQFATVSSNLAFLTPSLSYDNQNVRLTMTRNDTSFGPTPVPDSSGGSGGSSSSPDAPAPAAPAPNYIAGTRNQGGIASAAERLGSGNPVYDALISATADEARAGFALLSGETHAQGIAAAVGQGGMMRDTLLGHLRGALLSPSDTTVAAGFSADRPGRQDAVLLPAPVPQPRFRLWGEAYGAQGRSTADGNAASLHSRTGGFLLGADALIAEGAGSSFSLGVAGGYSRSDVDSDGRLSSGRLEAGQAALYAAARLGAWRLDGGLGYSVGETSLTRQVRIRGFGDTLRSQRDSRVAQAFAELGYGMSFQTFALEPFAQLALLRISTGSSVEQGGAAALRLLSSEQSLGFATLGLRAEAQLGAMPLFARGLLGWRYGFGDLTPQTLTTFAIGTTPAQVYGAPIDRNALIAEAGLDWRLGGGTTLGVAYSAALGKQAQDHALKGRFELRF